MDIVAISTNAELLPGPDAFRTFFAQWTCIVRFVLAAVSSVWLMAGDTDQVPCAPLLALSDVISVSNALDFVMLMTCMCRRCTPSWKTHLYAGIMAMVHAAIMVWSVTFLRLIVWQPCATFFVFVVMEWGAQTLNTSVYFAYVYMRKSGVKSVKMKDFVGTESVRITVIEPHEDVCAICLETFGPRSRISKLSCAHVYHHECIAAWIPRQAQCPLCKAAVLPREKIKS